MTVKTRPFRKKSRPLNSKDSTPSMKRPVTKSVIPVRLHVGYNEGRAFCLTMAPDAESVKRAHDRVGLPYDTITEIATATPADTFFRRP